MSFLSSIKSSLGNFAQSSIAAIFQLPPLASAQAVPSLINLSSTFGELDVVKETTQKYFKLINPLSISQANAQDKPNAVESKPSIPPETQPEKTTTITAKKIFEKANTWKETPYLYGGNSKDGIDCSHFVFQAYKAAGLDYGYYSTSANWQKAGFEETTDPKAGDLIMFEGHMGIVVDPTDKTFIGSQSSTGVAEASYSPKTYWGKKTFHFLHHPKVINE